MKAITRKRPLLMLNTAILAYDPAGDVPRMPPSPNDARYVRVEDMYSLAKNNAAAADATEDAMAKNRITFEQVFGNLTDVATSRSLIRLFEQMCTRYVYHKQMNLFKTSVLGKFDADRLPDLQRDFCEIVSATISTRPRDEVGHNADLAWTETK